MCPWPGNPGICDYAVVDCAGRITCEGQLPGTAATLSGLEVYIHAISATVRQRVAEGACFLCEYCLTAQRIISPLFGD
jgi:hypothetical protein